jgi:hypothetical protein
MNETARLALPLIAPGQAQKEMTHNEALAALDLLVQATVAGRADAPPADPEPGECWIVGDAPGGGWAGHAGALAGWSAAGWRFAAPREGMRAWDIDGAVPWTWRGGAWRRGEVRAVRLMVDGVKVVGAQAGAILDPAGGGTVDTQARAALSATLAALRAHGLIAGG